ncbi:hypothetical protein GCM10022402_42090 [Salinactinospora qingdaonensis]|uniref:Uncharacterized protein n=1 Tax=Salinactinospora qingdaonensis TaxID=702744 RepID=A0ABP7G9D5_9ACTN
MERLTTGLRTHGRIIIDALTERDRQRIIAAGKVAGRRLKRHTTITETRAGVLIEFDDLNDPPVRPSPATHQPRGAPSGATEPETARQRRSGVSPDPGK